MANFSHVGSNTPDQFGSYKLFSSNGVNIAATGNAVATLNLLQGTKYVIRRITVSDANKDISSGNVTIITSSDGNASNAVANNTVLSNVTAATTKYQDLGLSAGALATVYSSTALYVKVNTAVTGGTCDINVYGDIVSL